MTARSDRAAEPGTVVTLTGTTFTRYVATARLPLLVCVHVHECSASRTLMPLLRHLAQHYAGRLHVAQIDLETADFIVDQYSVTATPTLLACHNGDVVTRAVGFLPEGLLHQLCDELVAGNIADQWQWHPTEALFEDTVLVPLLRNWSFSFERQAPCANQAGRRSARGRIDILVHIADRAEPLTLFENKRQIGSEAALRQAVAQAHGYAQAVEAPSVVVATPASSWVYRTRGPAIAPIRRFTALQLHEQPHALRDLLLHLADTG